MKANKASAYAAGIFMPVCSSIFIILRILAKRAMKKGYAADDVFLVIGAFLVWAMAGIFLAGTVQGSIGSEYLANQSPKKLELDKLLWASLFVERLTFPIIKIGVVSWYRIIFVGRTFKILSMSLIAFFVLWSITYIFASIFECGKSPAAQWSTSFSDMSSCINIAIQQIAFEVIDFTADIFVVILPIPFIWKLKMTTSKKIGLTFTFLMAILSTIAAGIRMGVCIAFAYGPNEEYAEATTVALMWTLISACSGIIAASLPTLRPLFTTRSIQSVVDSTRSSVHNRSSLEKPLQTSKSDLSESWISDYEIMKTSVVTVTEERGEPLILSQLDLAPLDVASRRQWISRV